MTTRFFRKLAHQSHLSLAVDALLFIAMVGTTLCGLMISKSVHATMRSLLGEVNRVWKMIHNSTSDALLVLLGVHFPLHWKWVVAQIRRANGNPVLRLGRRNRSRDPELQRQQVGE